ncbi:MAG: hypothetical protein CSA03_00720 [Bacteroidetes bacterium]|nr:MAG: hypothetical protein CSA03_00720 [Bacteroidota bacterium]
MLSLSYKTILSIAIPLMGSSFIQSIVLLTDSSFLSRYDTLAFDASGNGGLIYITLFMILAGLNEGTQILMARRIGEEKESVLGSIFASSVLINLFIALILFAITWLIIPQIIDHSVNSQELGQLQLSYLNVRSLGFIPSVVSLAILAYLTASGKTALIFVNAILVAVTNIALDYALIFGNLGLPEMGLEGAALASAIADFVGLIVLIIAVFFLPKLNGKKVLTDLKVNWSRISRVLKVGSPIMLQGLTALLTWTIFFFWIEQMGIFELTVSQNIRSLYFLAFVPIWGFGATTKTYVSQYMGKKDFQSIAIATRRIQLLTMVFLIAIFHGAILYPEKLIEFVNPNEEFIETSASTLQFLFGSILLYGFGSIYFYTIAGSGNTRYSFIIELISVVLYLFFAFLFIKVLNWDIYYVWTVEYIYFGVICSLSIIYLRFFNWKKKQI